MASTFQLQDYVGEIKALATECKCSPQEAVDKFVVNLTIMRNHYKGADNLNFHELGQLWNKLGYQEKLTQKESAKQQIAKSARASRTRDD